MYHCSRSQGVASSPSLRNSALEMYPASPAATMKGRKLRDIREELVATRETVQCDPFSNLRDGRGCAAMP